MTVQFEAGPIAVTKFEGHFIAQLPDTFTMLRNSGLTVDPSVSRVILTGSRGLAGHYRSDSDVDLTLIVHESRMPDEPARRPFLHALLALTLGRWASPVRLDTAAVFDVCGCGLRCFDRAYLDPRPCPFGRGEDCFGLYKIRDGAGDYVTKGLVVRRIYPAIRIWRNRAYPIGGT